MTPKEREEFSKDVRDTMIEDEFEICTAVIDTLDNAKRFLSLIEHELPFKVRWYIRNKNTSKIVEES